MPSPKTKQAPLHAVPEIEKVQVKLHGHRVNFALAGDGPPIVLIHGVAGRAAQWEQTMQLLGEHYTVVAPDLLGHGESAKPRGDYSLGAFASGIRDLVVGLGLESATIVGHSLGGGIAMQFAYQFPEYCDRLVLVSSGGLGQEVNLLLRAATLPGSGIVLPVISHDRVLSLGAAVAGLLGKVGLRVGGDLEEMGRSYASLTDMEARNAFIQTVRAVIDPSGQRVNATDRLYLAQKMPALVVWGKRDPIIPATHSLTAHKGMPGSRLEIFEDSGHFPQLDDPLRFARTLASFMEQTEPARLNVADMRELVLSNDAETADRLKALRRKLDRRSRKAA